MYGIQKQQVRKLNQKEHYALKVLCRLAKNMYNVGVYNVRQHYFDTKNFLTYKENNQLSKSKIINT